MQESIVFLVRVQCRRKESSRSLSHLLMSFLLSHSSSLGYGEMSRGTQRRRLFGIRIPLRQAFQLTCTVFHCNPFIRSPASFPLSSAYMRIFQTKERNIALLPRRGSYRPKLFPLSEGNLDGHLMIYLEISLSNEKVTIFVALWGISYLSSSSFTN